jgi:membrane protease YdiL (CAAX protease family)
MDDPQGVSLKRGREVTARRSLAIEITVVTSIVLGIIHGLYLARGITFVGSHAAYLVAYILLGAPMLVLWLRKRPLDYFDLNIKHLVCAAFVFGIAALIIFPPFLLAAHGWQRIVFGYTRFEVAGFPGFANALVFQLLVIALPEEFYFRGYVQSAMNAVFPRKWKFLGAAVGWGLPVTAAIFAVAHTIVTYQWWHFAIFFPALVFGYLRERTGSIIAPTFFHAACNLLMSWFVRCYS